MNDDLHYMQVALEHARNSMQAGNRPIGSVIVRDGVILAQAGNTMFTDHDPTAHAEVATVRVACARLGTVELPGVTLYTTLEPCPMCLWALLEAKVARLVMGGRYASIGGFSLGRYTVESFLDFMERRLEVTTGIMQAECESMRIEWMKAQGPKSPGIVR
jgi:tRNA(Arg) A34 adenosine deaminase TadA